MLICNKQIISAEELVCSNIFSQSLGLMFRKRQNLIMIFRKEKKISLHNFFVFYPIDVLILDEHKKIVEIKRNFKPFNFWSSKMRGRYVVELGFPGNFSERYDVGNILEFSVQKENRY